ncbi:MAG: toluene tolerance protein [Deltaproteobacteria bacterium]|jgi:hypothetical protein|nr:toluene tolerance protein [Deltaproteobacteria bacterium]
MKRLDLADYERMVVGATVLAGDTHGNKLLQLSDGLMLKLFRRKRGFSSDVIWPYAKRFARGARELRERQIQTVEVVGTYRVKSIGRDAVVYCPLEGKSLRQALRDLDNQSDLITRFAAFFARLHERGIYFRATHFGNVVVTPKGEFGLIDVSEVYLSRSALSLSKRVRNFKVIFRYREDREAILASGFESFLDSYLENSSVSPGDRQSFVRRLWGVLPLDIL